MYYIILTQRNASCRNCYNNIVTSDKCYNPPTPTWNILFIYLFICSCLPSKTWQTGVQKKVGVEGVLGLRLSHEVSYLDGGFHKENQVLLDGAV